MASRRSGNDFSRSIATNRKPGALQPVLEIRSVLPHVIHLPKQALAFLRIS
jgi:hypothetical protein